MEGRGEVVPMLSLPQNDKKLKKNYHYSISKAPPAHPPSLSPMRHAKRLQPPPQNHQKTRADIANVVPLPEGITTIASSSKTPHPDYRPPDLNTSSQKTQAKTIARDPPPEPPLPPPPQNPEEPKKSGAVITRPPLTEGTSPHVRNYSPECLPLLPLQDPKKIRADAGRMQTDRTSLSERSTTKAGITRVPCHQKGIPPLRRRKPKRRLQPMTHRQNLRRPRPLKIPRKNKKTSAHLAQSQEDISGWFPQLVAS